MEIERKYIPKTLPENLAQYKHHKIEQAYLNTAPVVRIRKQDNEYFLTYKGGGMMAREEYNLPLNEKSYNHLLTKADGNQPCRHRHGHAVALCVHVHSVLWRRAQLPAVRAKIAAREIGNISF